MSPLNPLSSAGSLHSPPVYPAAGGAAALSKFLSKLRRRMIVVRMLEAAGVGMLAAATVSLTLTLLLLDSGRNTTPLCFGALLLGASVGALWSFAHRPTLLDAAIETDHQMDLSDLLTTAVTAIDQHDPWQAAVIAMADQRCAGLLPSDVVLARFGARAWGGIGLSAALVLAIGALSISPAKLRATADDAETESTVPFAAVEQPPPIYTPPAARSQSRAPSSDDKSSALTPEKMDDATTGQSAIAHPRTSPNRGSSDGKLTASSAIADVPAVNPIPASHHQSISYGTAPFAGGGGHAESNAAPGDDGANSVAAPSGSSNVSPSGKLPSSLSSDFNLDNSTLRGPVPDSCRDVAQRYFHPD